MRRKGSSPPITGKSEGFCSLKDTWAGPRSSDSNFVQPIKRSLGHDANYSPE